MKLKVMITKRRERREREDDTHTVRADEQRVNDIFSVLVIMCVP